MGTVSGIDPYSNGYTDSTTYTGTISANTDTATAFSASIDASPSTAGYTLGTLSFNLKTQTDLITGGRIFVLLPD